MIDHLSLGVGDLARSRAFYDAVLAPLGYVRVYDFDEGSGYGRPEPHPRREQALPFWILQHRMVTTNLGLHICFGAPTRAAVDEFHAAALAAGGTDNGKPGLRPQYHAQYYAAFVFDPDGHKIEAVRHEPE
jgi:catechol 2,3-dioxygenase-like lactoylglutathione lyase family enzyme